MSARKTATDHRGPRTTSQPHLDLPAIVRADPAETRALAALVADAFFLLPPSIWLVPEPDFRAPVMREYFAIAVQHAFAHGIVETLADRSGVAVWFDNTRPAPPPADYEQHRLTACGRWAERFVYLDGELGRHHPAEPHQHLAFLAVAPNVQGTGRGTALLHHRHEVLDGQRLPAYLEAASERLVGVYQRFGYQAGDPFYLAADGPSFYPMWREPRAMPND
jgi:GNAT superfamily N-acetyltransferase